MTEKTIVARRSYGALLLCLISVFCSYGLARSHGDSEARVKETIPTTALEQDLASRHSVFLNRLLNDPAKRRNYVRSVYVRRQLETAIATQGLSTDQALLEGLRNARERLLIDALVRKALSAKRLDIEALAEERYEAQRKDYMTRKKIKLAVIYVQKEIDREGQARRIIDSIAMQLRENPYDQNLFHDLAKKYSDDRKAARGGIIKEWLIAPVDLEKRDPLMQAAFSLETVGEITDIVETDKGFAIAKLLALTPSRRIPFDEAKADIIVRIESELWNRTRSEVLSALQPDKDFVVNDELLQQKIIQTLRLREDSSPKIE